MADKRLLLSLVLLSIGITTLPVRGDRNDRDWWSGGYRDRDSGYDNDRDYDRGYEKHRERRELERERERLEDERRALEAERERMRQTQEERCPQGFHPGNHRCTNEERRRGCKDMRMPGGTTCNAGPFS